jgi:hypothetical protein
MRSDVSKRSQCSVEMLCTADTKRALHFLFFLVQLVKVSLSDNKFPTVSSFVTRESLISTRLSLFRFFCGLPLKQIKLYVAKVIHGRKFYTRKELFIPVTGSAVSTRRGWPILCYHGSVCIDTEYCSCMC